MPSSNPETIPVAIDLAWQLSPRTVLDVGAGYGKYGVLFREYLELRHRRTGRSADTASLSGGRQTRVDAVEGFAGYVGELHRIVYDNVYLETLAQYLLKAWNYDFIFIGDVLEHIEKDEATQLLPKLIERANIGVLISVPAHVRDQGAEFDNELEVHRSTWTGTELRSLAPYGYVGRKGSHLIAFLTKDRDAVARVQARRWSSWFRRLMRAGLDAW